MMDLQQALTIIASYGLKLAKPRKARASSKVAQQVAESFTYSTENPSALVDIDFKVVDDKPKRRKLRKRGKRSPKVTKAQVKAIKKDLKTNMTYKQIGKKHGIGDQTIGAIYRGRIKGI